MGDKYNLSELASDFPLANNRAFKPEVIAPLTKTQRNVCRKIQTTYYKMFRTRTERVFAPRYQDGSCGSKDEHNLLRVSVPLAENSPKTGDAFGTCKQQRECREA